MMAAMVWHERRALHPVTGACLLPLWCLLWVFGGWRGLAHLRLHPVRHLLHQLHHDAQRLTQLLVVARRAHLLRLLGLLGLHLHLLRLLRLLHARIAAGRLVKWCVRRARNMPLSLRPKRKQHCLCH